MKKANKILMATVAILLCLVLLSTSIVSGIFARFVIKHTATTAITLGKFGVDVSLIPNTSALQDAGAEVKLVKDEANNILSATVTGLKIIPGMDLSDAFKIKFSGTTNVDVDVSIDFCFDYAISDFSVPANVGEVSSKTYFMPIGLKFGAYYNSSPVIASNYIYDGDSDKTNNITPYHHQGQKNVETFYAKGIQNLIDVTAASRSCTVHTDITDYAISKTFYVDDNISDDILFYADTDTAKANPINEFVFGFDWPNDYASEDYDKDTLDLVGTYLASKKYDKTISFTYTIKLEQITG